MKALALFSGGLDSMLSVRLLSDQGIEVEALYMDIGFGGTRSDVERLEKNAKQAGGTFRLVDARSIYLKEVLFSPKYGYGKHFNPCIDCHGFMFRTALGMLDELDASFVISGEVVGQRPMSQRSQAMRSVSKLALNDDDLILRPLCAKNLPETYPERQGWVDREKLLDISGRGRVRQLELAKKYGFTDYESPAGGCLLTLDAYAKKIKDFIAYEDFETEDIELLKFGRHLRLPQGAKLVVGRNEEDNKALLGIKNKKHAFLKLKNISGPVSLISSDASEEDIELATSLVLAYTKAKQDELYELEFMGKTLKASPLSSKEKAREFFVL